MSWFPRSPASLDDEALDRVLSRAEVPEVPSELANRIVSTVTRLPQEASARHAPPNLRIEPARRRPALVALLALVVVLGGGALGLWLSAGPARPGIQGGGPVIAEAPPAAADRVAEMAIAGNQPDSTTIHAKRDDEPAARDEFERTEHDPAPGAPTGILPEATPGSVNDPTLDFASEAEPSTPAEHLSAPENPVGPSMAGSAGSSPLTPDSPVYGPPAPRGLGIAGSGPSQTPSIGPVGTDPSGAGPGPRPTGTGPVGPGPGTRR